MRLQRTAWCGELAAADAGREVVVCGWVEAQRDHGGLLFIDLRDRSGLVQIVIDPRRSGPLWETAKQWRAEWTVGVRGRVGARLPENRNPRLPSGEVEVEAAEAEVFSPAAPLPFQLEAGADVDEAMRLRYRYLDLRRPALQANLRLRHRFAKAVRDHLDARGFSEVETPTLTRSTPEGARDYLVPARTAPGHFFALPQSPQIYKQLLMVAGLERYFQLARCWRDEDLRADRQPEFTQIDIEMSFVGAAEVMALAEGMVCDTFRAAAGVELPAPFPRLTHAAALARYGSDKPDLRVPLEIVDASAVFAATAFQGFAGALAAGGVVRLLRVPGGAVLTRRELDALTVEARGRGAGGLAWFLLDAPGPGRVEGGGARLVAPGGRAEVAVRSPIAKFLTDAELAALVGAGEGGSGDALLAVADRPAVAAAVLGWLRLWAAERFGLRGAEPWCPVWVTDFPLLEWSEEEGRFTAVHHPFTAPHPDDRALLSSAPGDVRAQAYDLVLNGTEVGGGSIRIHDQAEQRAVFSALGITPEQAADKFGFLLEALSFGAPPHGGIAFGLDRLVMMLAGAETIREVIAFPKNARAADPLTGAPAAVAPRQLRDLGIHLDDGRPGAEMPKPAFASPPSGRGAPSAP